MKALPLVAATALIASALAPNALADGRKPGSVLVYPVHRSGSGHQFFTVVCVTNINRTPQNPNSFGGSTGVWFEYVNVRPNAADPFKPLGCSIFDRHEFLTPADTLCVLTSCHNATFGTGQEGYLVVSAEDPSRAPGARWSHNHLIGSAMVVSGSGVVYSTEAIPFKSPLRSGDRTDLNNNFRIDFDGWEYEEIPDQLYIDSFVALGGSQLALLNLTGSPRDCNTVYFAVWNDNEFALSTTLVFSCWFDQPLVNISTLFSESFLRSTPHDPHELDINCDGVGDIETGWACIDSIDVSQPGGASISYDGAMLGCITAGVTTVVSGGRLLWESYDTQNNGEFRRP
jgi:hypothetical protein